MTERTLIDVLLSPLTLQEMRDAVGALVDYEDIHEPHANRLARAVGIAVLEHVIVETKGVLGPEGYGPYSNKR